jgi:hypothetical protein
MRDMKVGKEEDEDVAVDDDDEDNEEEDNEEEEEDANTTIVGVQVARSHPNDRESERVCRQEDPIISDTLCRLLRGWPFNRAMVKI